ncbi:MAG: hypothetical protein KF861_09370 [Planctomycetaceae bacterium]|nr:hypothetical protein [Planctomycetaceae bacterium]
MMSLRWSLAVALLSVSATAARANDGAWSAPIAQVSGASTPEGGVVGGAPVAAYGGGTYPVLNAPLYPAPVQHVPGYAGGTIITNQALAPHEMLYPHSYHAMYPPFYYRVKGHWMVTPFGVRQHENWKLEGTHVKVKYRDHYRPFSQFHPPVSH